MLYTTWDPVLCVPFWSLSAVGLPFLSMKTLYLSSLGYRLHDVMQDLKAISLHAKRARHLRSSKRIRDSTTKLFHPLALACESVRWHSRARAKHTHTHTHTQQMHFSAKSTHPQRQRPGNSLAYHSLPLLVTSVLRLAKLRHKSD
jgi:hypothetical protein